MATVKTNSDVFEKAWEGFKGTDWKEKASVSRFVQANYTPYDGDESFLAGVTERSLHIKKVIEETKAHYEATRFPYDTRPTSIAGIPAGYIDKDQELIVGIQNDELFKLNFMPKGGIRMAETTLKENGYEPDPAVHEIFTKYVTTVNDGIFRAYTSNIRRARHAHTVTGLPDAYSRGRIIGVYACKKKSTTGMLSLKSMKNQSVFAKKLTSNTKPLVKWLNSVTFMVLMFVVQQKTLKKLFNG